MASFTAVLSISTLFETDINAFTMGLHQTIDGLGRPASQTHGGQLTITFNTTNDPIITGWMMNPTLQRDGSVTFYNLVGQEMKTIAFTNAYCIDLDEAFDGTDNGVHMETTIVISPEKITVSGIAHDNDWPPTAATH